MAPRKISNRFACTLLKLSNGTNFIRRFYYCWYKNIATDYCRLGGLCWGITCCVYGKNVATAAGDIVNGLAPLLAKEDIVGIGPIIMLAPPLAKLELEGGPNVGADPSITGELLVEGT